MGKTILITGATDGIGLETAKLLVAQGHILLLHGRNPAKLAAVEKELSALTEAPRLECYLANLSRIDDVHALAEAVRETHATLDVLINNAGVYKVAEPVTPDGLDTRFMVNTLAPYRLTRLLLPLLPGSGRVVNLSSAAQAPVDPQALAGQTRLDDMTAYAQSKLAITMWSFRMAQTLVDGPAILAINPGSLLASKMVKDGFGVAGNDLRIGAEILVRAALSDEFADASGTYFDNDEGQFALPHRDALDPVKSAEIVQAIEAALDAIAPLVPQQKAKS